MEFYDSLTFFGGHVLPAFAQLVAVAMAVVVTMMTMMVTSETAEEDFAE